MYAPVNVENYCFARPNLFRKEMMIYSLNNTHYLLNVNILLIKHIVQANNVLVSEIRYSAGFKWHLNKIRQKWYC